jgi:hypothetical protein
MTGRETMRKVLTMMLIVMVCVKVGGNKSNSRGNTVAASTLTVTVRDNVLGKYLRFVDLLYLTSLQPASWWYPTRYPTLYSILAFPFHLLSSLVRFLRLPTPQFRFSSLTFYRPLRTSNLQRAPHAWLRDLEDETGAYATSTAISMTTSSSSSSSKPRPDAHHQHSKVLPNFMLSSYDQFLRKCQTDVRIGCVILVSEEHDNVAEFKKWSLSLPSPQACNY